MGKNPGYLNWNYTFFHVSGHSAPPQSTFIRRGDPTTLDLEIANALLQLHSSASAPPNIEAIKVKEEPITTFEESQNFLEEKAASINEEEDKENHQPMSYNNHTVSSQFISKKSAICLKNSWKWIGIPVFHEVFLVSSTTCIYTGEKTREIQFYNMGGAKIWHCLQIEIGGQKTSFVKLI